MPYKSKAQHRLFRVLEAEGKLPKGTASEWAHHTPNMRKLPEHKHTEKKAEGSPPNYRQALGMVSTCGTCFSYEPSSSMCRKFAVQVNPIFVCDLYKQSKHRINNIQIDTKTIPEQKPVDFTSGVDIKTPDIQPIKLASFGSPSMQAAGNTNPVQQIQGVGFGGSGQKPPTIGMGQPGQQLPIPKPMPPGHIVQWLDSQAKQLMQQKKPQSQQQQPQQPQPQQPQQPGMPAKLASLTKEAVGARAKRLAKMENIIKQYYSNQVAMLSKNQPGQKRLFENATPSEIKNRARIIANNLGAGKDYEAAVDHGNWPSFLDSSKMPLHRSTITNQVKHMAEDTPNLYGSGRYTDGRAKYRFGVGDRHDPSNPHRGEAYLEKAYAIKDRLADRIGLLQNLDDSRSALRSAEIRYHKADKSYKEQQRRYDEYLASEAPTSWWQKLWPAKRISSLSPALVRAKENRVSRHAAAADRAMRDVSQARDTVDSNLSKTVELYQKEFNLPEDQARAKVLSDVSRIKDKHNLFVHNPTAPNPITAHNTIARHGFAYDAPPSKNKSRNWIGPEPTYGYGVEERLDQIARSGRHSQTHRFPDLPSAHINRHTPMPDANTAYSGFQSTTNSFAPNRITRSPISDNHAFWFSGYPQVSTGYVLNKTINMSGPGGPSLPDYLMESPVDQLKKLGPSSPHFHQHLAQDTRGMSSEDVSKITPYRANSLPHYESVFSAPGTNMIKMPLNRMYKKLPGTKGFQTIYEAPKQPVNPGYGKPSYFDSLSL